MSNLHTPEKVHKRLQDLLEEESTRRDVQTAIDLQERMQYKFEDDLTSGLQFWEGWNYSHAREIAELAWVEMYAEK